VGSLQSICGSVLWEAAWRKASRRGQGERERESSKSDFDPYRDLRRIIQPL
jgi:hypothetical protein